MLQNQFPYASSCYSLLTKWSFLVHSTTRNAPDIHPRRDSILELRQTFRNGRRHLIIIEQAHKNLILIQSANSQRSDQLRKCANSHKPSLLAQTKNGCIPESRPRGYKT